MFTPKDKLAEWFEYYAMAMELNIWTNTTLSKSTWSDKDGKWTVNLERGDQKRESIPLHLPNSHNQEPFTHATLYSQPVIQVNQVYPISKAYKTFKAIYPIHPHLTVRNRIPRVRKRW